MPYLLSYSVKCLLISTQGKSQTPRLDRAQYRVPQVSCHAYTRETEGLTAVSPGFSDRKVAPFWLGLSAKERGRQDESFGMSIACRTLSKFNEKSSNGLGESRVRQYDDDNTRRSRNRKPPGQTKRGDRFPSPRGVQEGAARAAGSTRNQPNRLRKPGERATQYVTTVQRRTRRRGGGRAAGLLPLQRGDPGHTTTKGGPGHTNTKGGDGGEGGSGVRGTDTTTTKGNTPTWTHKR